MNKTYVIDRNAERPSERELSALVAQIEKVRRPTYSCPKKRIEGSSELADSAIEFLRVAEKTYNTISQKLIPDDRTMRKALILSGLVYAALC